MNNIPAQLPGHANDKNAKKVSTGKLLPRPRRQVFITEYAVCQCPAYPFPHRMRQGRCRYPDPPAPRPAKPKGPRLRLRGSLKRLAQQQGLLPVKHHALILKYLKRLAKSPRVSVWSLMTQAERKQYPGLEDPIIFRTRSCRIHRSFFLRDPAWPAPITNRRKSGKGKS